MFSDQRTVGVGGGGGWPPNESAGPTQFGGSSTEDRPTPRTIPAEDLGVWSPQPPPPPVGPAAPFRSTSEPSVPAGSQTVLMQTTPEKVIPLAWVAIVEGRGGKRGTVFTLKPETVIGRAYGDFLLSGDPTVSSQHAKIRLEPKEEGEGEVFVLYDLASANGTYVGTKETFRDESSRVYRHELKDGDYLLLGETALVFKQVEG